MNMDQDLKDKVNSGFLELAVAWRVQAIRYIKRQLYADAQAAYEAAAEVTKPSVLSTVPF